MPTLDTYRKQARLLQRWHREGNYSVGGKVRQLPRHSALTDRQVLDMPFPLALAQEIVAVEAGHAGWAALKAAVTDAPKTPRPPAGAPMITGVVPILLVRDVTVSAAYFRDRLGFEVDFLHGLPPFAATAAREASLICASFEVSHVQALFAEFSERGADFAQTLMKQAWGGTDFHVRDPDGNVVSFVTYG